jgi:hypothetical protein
MNPSPSHKKPALERYTGTYLQWWQVQDIAEEEGVPVKSVRVLLSRESGARYYLPKRMKPLYIRRVVLDLLGLANESQSHRKL